MPIPIADLAIAGLGALGDFLLGSSGTGATIVQGRPRKAFSAQDQVLQAISEELAASRARQGQPIALPNIDVSALGGITSIPGLDVGVGIRPEIAGLGTADFFSDINATRAAAPEPQPPGRRLPVPRGERPGERRETGLGEGRAGERITDLGTPGNPGTGERTLLGHVDETDTLDLIGSAIRDLLARTDVSKIGPTTFDPQTLQST